MKNFLIILGFPLWFPLLIAVFAVLLSLYVTAFALLIALWAVFAALSLSAIAVLVWGVSLCVIGNAVVGLAAIGTALFALGASLLLFAVSTVATKATVALPAKALSKIRYR